MPVCSVPAGEETALAHLWGLVGYRGRGGEDFLLVGGRRKTMLRAPQISIPTGMTLILLLTWRQKEFEATLGFPKMASTGLQFDWACSIHMASMVNHCRLPLVVSLTTRSPSVLVTPLAALAFPFPSVIL